MRNIIAAVGLVVVIGSLTFAECARAETAAPSASQIAQRSSDISSQNRRPRTRVRIYRNDDDRGVYPSYNPGPNAVRDCTATYVQEFRPSGTVIVPRMNCFWRRG